ncbi:MAG: glycosyltransferase family 2 protein [Gammaproteobacteria bacterium]|nr:glycosyltransferase family 2 protein [Gammaproteobacteria bacterium]
MKPAIDCVIVNFNTGPALVRSVASVLEQSEAARLVVIDNASSDDSCARLREAFGERPELKLVLNRDNVGFARAVNQALDEEIDRDSRFVLILNPDAELEPGALRALRSALEAQPDAALAGPTVVGEGGGVLRGTLRRFPDPAKSLMTVTGLWRLEGRHARFRGVEVAAELPRETVRAEAVSGACMLVRSDALRALGGMDPAYGLHCEDLDLMFRLREAGRPCLFVPSARVIHQQGVSSGSRPLWVHWQKHRGMQRFFRKFQADDYSPPLRWLIISGIWLRYAVTLPLTLVRR